ncbi:MAG: hypothetical protein JXA90_07420 [Planctomycetes bacterium]|nr:hypothetical protein [Planctomycetota bacterium]
MRTGSLKWAVWAFIGIAAGLSGPGCETAPDPNLDAVTKARLARQYRERAEQCLARFSQDSTAIEELECFTENYRKATVLFPDPREWPTCYFKYGQGLSMLGGYYLTLRNKLKELPPGRQSGIEEKIREAEEKTREYFQRSNEALEAYFQTGYANPRAYDMASRQYGFLGDYSRALHYLNRLSQTRRLSDSDKEIVEQRRKFYTRMLEKEAFRKGAVPPSDLEDRELDMGGFGDDAPRDQGLDVD